MENNRLDRPLLATDSGSTTQQSINALSELSFESRNLGSQFSDSTQKEMRFFHCKLWHQSCFLILRQAALTLPLLSIAGDDPSTRWLLYIFSALGFSFSSTYAIFLSLSWTHKVTELLNQNEIQIPLLDGKSCRKRVEATLYSLGAFAHCFLITFAETTIFLSLTKNLAFIIPFFVISFFGRVVEALEKTGVSIAARYAAARGAARQTKNMERKKLGRFEASILKIAKFIRKYKSFFSLPRLLTSVSIIFSMAEFFEYYNNDIYRNFMVGTVLSSTVLAILGDNYRSDLTSRQEENTEHPPRRTTCINIYRTIAFLPSLALSRSTAMKSAKCLKENKTNALISTIGMTAASVAFVILSGLFCSGGVTFPNNGTYQLVADRVYLEEFILAISAIFLVISALSVFQVVCGSTLAIFSSAIFDNLISSTGFIGAIQFFCPSIEKNNWGSLLAFVVPLIFFGASTTYIPYQYDKASMGNSLSKVSVFNEPSRLEDGLDQQRDTTLTVADIAQQGRERSSDKRIETWRNQSIT